MEGHFAHDAGQVPAKFVVAPEAAQVKNHAVNPGQLCFQIKSALVCFHVRFLSLFARFFVSVAFYKPMRNRGQKRIRKMGNLQGSNR